MKISDLNRRVTIQAPARLGNNAGGTSKSWTDAGTVWAQMIPLRGSEALAETLQRDVQLWKITIRFRGNVSTDHRLMFRDTPLNIRTCTDPDGHRQWIVMTCESGVRT